MRKAFLSAILSIAMCLSLIAGATFALFTSTSEVNISVTSGKVDMEATVSNLYLKDLNETDYTRSVADGETANFESSGNADTRTLTFTNGNTLALANIVCGDSVKFSVDVTNNSTVNVKYRVAISADGELFSGLKVSMNGEAFLGKTYSSWKSLEVGTNGDSIPVEITLPDTGNNEHDNQFQGKECKIVVSVEGIQGNAETFNDTNAGAVVDTEKNATTGKVETTEDVTINSNGFGAEIPTGTILKDNATTTTLVVTKEDASAGNFNFEAAGGEAIGFNISIPEVAEDNETPITITIKDDNIATNLNGVMLYHKGVAMVPVNSAAEVDADGEFFYDATDASITLATKNFSNFTVVMINKVEVSTEAELKTAIDKGASVIFTSNITLTDTLLIKKNVVIDLNGYTLDGNLASYKYQLLQSSSDYNPSVVLTSSKNEAKINAGDKSVILGYGSTTIYNVTINIGKTSSSCVPFKIPGDLTLGANTVVNVEYLGSSLISNGAKAIVIDGATINVKEFKVNGGDIININAATIVTLNDATFNVGLNMTYYSLFINRSADNVTINDCEFNVTDCYGLKYDVVRLEDEYVDDKYGWMNRVTVNSETELKNAIASGKNVRFGADITLTATLLIKKNVIIDLNGHTLDANLSSNQLLQSSSDSDPSVVIVSYVSGAKINAGDKSVILGYGSTKIYNVEINVGTVTSSSNTPFNVYGDLTLGAGTVVNVEFLGTSLISNNGQIAIVIDGATINVKTFRVNGGSMIYINNATTIALNNAEFNVVLDTTYSSKLINSANNVTVNNCKYNVTDLDGAKYNVTDTYGWVKA